MGGNPCFGESSFHPVFTDPLLEPWRWQVFPELSGLSAQCIAEGANGSIWFGAARGAWSFDGVEWTHYPPAAISGSSVTSICQAKDGHLYAAANKEISRFDGHQWQPLLRESGLLPEGTVRKIAAGDEGTLWVASSKGLLHYRQSTWTLYTGNEFAQRLHSSPAPLSGRIELLPESAFARMRADSPAAGRYDFSDVCVDRQGRIWLGTEEGEVLCFAPPSAQSASNGFPVAEPGKWSVYNEADGMVCGRFPSILAAQDGRIWVVYGAGSSHANVFDGRTWSTIDLAGVGVPQDCGNLLQTRDGVIWVSGRYVVCALRDGQWSTYEKPAVPIPSARNFLMQASDGALWMGGPGTEILRVDYQTSRWLTMQDLNFQWESPTGVQWFLHRDGRVVVHNAGQWSSFGAEDGVIDAPVALLGTRSGEVWVAGSHEHIAATARYDGRQWARTIHAELSWGIDERGVMESSDGSVWFSATVDSHGPEEHRAGILQYRNGEWIHHHQPGRTPGGGRDDDSMTLLPAGNNPQTIGKFYCLGESDDGKIWAGRNNLLFQDRLGWHVEPPLSNLFHRLINRMFTSSDGMLWVSTLQFGAQSYHNGVWRVFQGKGQLEANSVYSIVETSDGSIWAATERGFSRYDGRTWTPSSLPEAMNIPLDGGDLKASATGALWINRRAREWNYRAWPRFGQTVATNCEFWTVCHQFQGIPPQTFISMGSEKVSPPGNLAVSWRGTVPWRQLKDSKLQYSFRLDDQEWSEFSPESGHSFFTLPVGLHHLEVRARDQDFNVDPSPAVLDFVVLPPVWRQVWFILLVFVLVGLVLAQSLRVARERSQLRRLTLELDQRVSQRTAQLEASNKELESFSYSVSHDLRAPLRHIDGFMELLQRSASATLDKQSIHYMTTIKDAVKRMGMLVDDLLALSRTGRQALSKTKVDLQVLAQEVVGDFAHETTSRTINWIIHDLPVVSADKSLMHAVLVNLISNAIKFTGPREVAEIEIGSYKQDAQSVIFIRDNGVGFDMKYVDRLFGVFQRLHAADEFEGTGIGLVNVHRIIERHGGRIWAEAEVDKGATFYFTL